MKCSYCQNPLDKDAQFCPNCGTILGAQVDDNYDDLDEISIEDVSNVFKAPVNMSKENIETEKPAKKSFFAKKSKPVVQPTATEAANETELDKEVEIVLDPLPQTQVPTKESEVPAEVEIITDVEPDYIAQPTQEVEFNEKSIETPVVVEVDSEPVSVAEPEIIIVDDIEIKIDEVEEPKIVSAEEITIAPIAKPKKGKKARKNKKAAEKKIEKYEEAFAPEEAFSNAEDIKEEPAKESEPTDIYSYTDPDNKAEELTAQVEETPVVTKQDIYKTFQPIVQEDDEEEQMKQEAEEAFDLKSDNKKSKKWLSPLLIAAVAVIVMIAFNFDLVEELVDKVGIEISTTQNIEDADSSIDGLLGEEETTDEDETQEDETQEDSTEEDTDIDEEMDDEDEDSQESQDTLATQITATTTTQAAATTTTQAATTTTTQSSTTTTTQAATTTTQSSTTTTSSSTSTTTDPYGINDVTVQTPTTYLSSSYTSYVLYSGLMITNTPSSSGERVIYVELGADLTVLAVQDGYSYVRSNRIGVYGWISNSNISTSRPVESTTSTTAGVELPDTIYDTFETMYIIPSDGLNLRYGPSTSYDIIKNIQQNYEVQVVGYSDGDESWVYIIDSTYGITGWVSAEYLSDTPVR